MTTHRTRALERVRQRPASVIEPTTQLNSELFAEQVFRPQIMRRYVSPSVWKALSALPRGGNMSHEVADEVANAMKTWALERGVTHYTHWFQPLTESTAEKHDALLRLTSDGPIEALSGESLLQQEPDASSLPSGGIRNTFEARGYTAWDPSSPAFIFNGVLCIPSIFISYTGEALDYKTPLLKTIQLVDQAATKVCQLFDPQVEYVNVTLGPEQEFFLIDEAFVYARPDLRLAGRTVAGALPARGQQLEDHYFGSIPARVQAYLVELEHEALRLGIPLTTRHNEVAPSQFELAPHFEEMNISVDHNQLLMDLMQKVARNHHLQVLLHEKPFAGINGSGKHNNWSLSTNTGVNLLSPGKTREENLRFLTFFIITLRALYEHADLLRASIASHGNDFRLGANEAPPAIISAFIGSELSSILDKLEKNTRAETINENVPMELDVDHIPDVHRHNTDRNRTSPFAFTGNKFELRASGSSANNASGMIVLNTIVADQLNQFHSEVEQLTAQGEDTQKAILQVLSRYSRESRPVRFEGDGYSDEWLLEAEKRGLTNERSTPYALGFYRAAKAVRLFTENQIFTEREINARWEIRMEMYIKQMDIEARLLEELALNQVIPAAVAYQKNLAEVVDGLDDADLDAKYSSVHRKLLKRLSKHIHGLYTGVRALRKAQQEADQLQDMEAKGKAYYDQVFASFDAVRLHADELEALVDDELWPLPKYREMLFSL